MLENVTLNLLVIYYQGIDKECVGRKEQLFEIRVKPHTPTITTTAEQLRGTALQKVPVNISGMPLDAIGIGLFSCTNKSNYEWW